MTVVSMKELLETGVHFGHRTRKWNPRMKPYIFTERNSIHIIDLQQTLESLEEAYALVRDTVAGGGNILFVGTKRQAQETIQVEAERCGMPYVNARWLGGTLTNWRTIRSRIDELEDLERRRDEGEFELLTKKEALTMQRRIDKLQERLSGIRGMKTTPQLLYVVDVRREDTSVHEANLLGLPVIALVDTNCDPSKVDYVIPSNDDAIRAIKLLTATIAKAAVEGLEMRKDREDELAEREAVDRRAVTVEMTDDELLGEATLAKLQSGEFDETEAAADAEPKAKAEADAEPKAEAAADAEPKAEAAADAEPKTEAEASAPAAEEAEDEAEAEATAGDGDSDAAEESEADSEVEE